jgi:imidazole glycerol-phosphate synthase subunit HisH
MAEVTLVDYGVGNIRAFANIYDRLSISVEIGDSAQKIRDARRLVLPGVGAFDWAMTRLNQSKLKDTLNEKVLQHGTPVIGICVGMQIMMDSSDEGQLPGLGWIKGCVARMTQSGNTDIPLPHMGWNDVTICAESPIFVGLNDLRYYFLHSYAVVPTNDSDKLATSAYGTTFVSAIKRENAFGVQFHPEKSHHWGVQLLKNFAYI